MLQRMFSSLYDLNVFAARHIHRRPEIHSRIGRHIVSVKMSRSACQNIPIAAGESSESRNAAISN
ncbi:MULTISPECIES: hypothetical protein [unclassified Bradyrhizobium]|uniref:hypothetical protein n=1 Tax=unclassified Bradyrhizobium TaxID=2631580 RepID=UPI0028E32F7F|nr:MULTISPECIES: hypothetical protein [unclassified Bradyrhizobium]